MHILDLPNLQKHLSQFLKTRLCTLNWFHSISSRPLDLTCFPVGHWLWHFPSSMLLPAHRRSYRRQVLPPQSPPGFQAWVRLRSHTLCPCTRVSSSQLEKAKQVTGAPECGLLPPLSSALGGGSFPGPRRSHFSSFSAKQDLSAHRQPFYRLKFRHIFTFFLLL